MALQATYLGFQLAHPFVPGASPMARNLDTVRRLEDAGTPMIVLHSLFAEQIMAHESGSVEAGGEALADSLIVAHRMRSDLGELSLNPDAYLEHIGKLRRCLDESTPVVASLNVTRDEGWMPYVRLIDQAGADALELNIYSLPSDPNHPSEQIERRILQIVRRVKQESSLPVAVKLLPFYTSLIHFARRLGEEGADGLILFNRLYQPDVNITAQQEEPSLQLSTSADLLVPLRWVGILSGRVKPDLVVTGGVQRAEDAVKAIMCGASIVQVVSLLLKRGPEFLSVLVENLRRWMDANGHSNLDDIRGSMSLRSFPSPESFERGLYMHLLQTWTRPTGRL